ncbi:MAG: hypothetical protein WC780_18310 [Lentimicrobiaceae bacterium]|jgi:hypothetical protein
MRNFIFILVAVAIVFGSCGKSDEADVYDPAADGIVGEWQSSGTNVAPLLAYFTIDSIYAKFNVNNTYHVESFTSTGTKTTYEGTYTQAKSSTGSIWTIILNQSTPSAVTSEGMFEITKVTSGYTMKYEVVQTQPSLGTPPTPAAGFGSTSGGALGTNNVQTFVQIVK